MHRANPSGVVASVRLTCFGAISGVMAGFSSYLFLVVLDQVTEVRDSHGWLLFLLPVAGLAIGLAHHHVAGRAVLGTALLMDEVRSPKNWLPRRMAPIVVLGTWTTHLFGGSAGREGTAVQMSGGLTDTFCRSLKLEGHDRQVLLIAALAGGFGAVFGVPIAGTVFAMEVLPIGRLRRRSLLPALSASVIGDATVTILGYRHGATADLTVSLSGWTLPRVAVAAGAFGLAALAFVRSTRAIASLTRRSIRWRPLRPAVGGAAIVGLAALCGRDYLGLSLPLAGDALAGSDVATLAFVLKLVFTAVTVGCGLPGGEVTPLFVVGATLGATLSSPLGLPASLLAAVGFVSVFAGAARVPITCIVMGVELFGVGAMAPVAIGCAVSFFCSTRDGIYAPARHAD